MAFGPQLFHNKLSQVHRTDGDSDCATDESPRGEQWQLGEGSIEPPKTEWAQLTGPLLNHQLQASKSALKGDLNVIFSPD